MARGGDRYCDDRDDVDLQRVAFSCVLFDMDERAAAYVLSAVFGKTRPVRRRDSDRTYVYTSWFNAVGSSPVAEFCRIAGF